MSPVVLTQKTRRRLESRLIPSSGGCKLWPSEGRHGRISIAGKLEGSHRVALAQKLGRVLRKGEVACHTCDVERCCAGGHLFVGTQFTNMQDMAAKGRWGNATRTIR
jgi:hypothetical protein